MTIKTILEEFDEKFVHLWSDDCDSAHITGGNDDESLLYELKDVKSFFSTKLNEMLGEIEKEIKATQEEVSESQGTHKHDSCYDDSLTIISKYKE